jgi:hypothetical protein
MAQVGHPPGDSPYKAIETSTAIEAYVGTISGGGGPIPVGPRDGPIEGVRILLRAKSTISLGFSAWFAQTVRTTLDPTATLAERFGPEVDQSLFGGELTIQFNLTGGKSWHGVAPFAGVGIGMLKSEAFTDSSGYEFGSKFYFAPNVGSRVFLTKRSYLRLEARGFTWKLSYPGSYSQEPVDEPGTTENPNAVNPTGRRSQYMLAPTLIVGLGYDF